MNRLLLLVLLLLIAPVLRAAPPVVVPPTAKILKGFSGSHFRNRTNLQSTVQGNSATPLSTNEVLVNRFEMKTYRDGDTKQVQLITSAPECRIDVDGEIAWSTNRLQVYTPTTNFFIEGRGFLCVQSNSLLVISNDVATRLPKPSTNSNLRIQTTQPKPGESVRIYSDRFELHYDSNRVVYSGRVRVLNEDTEMRCGHLVTIFNTNRYDTNTTIDRITAEDHVSISMSPTGVATGDRAVYTLTNGNELVELDGHATWDDGERQGKADRFSFDRGRNRLKADGKVAIRFPNNTLDQTNLESAVVIDTNRLSDLYAEHVTIQLLPTNAVESILAEDNVVITNHYDRSRATAQRAFYNKTTEQFELTGDPVCELQGKGEIRGKVLSLSRMSQVFSARGDSQVKLNLPPAKSGSALLAASTNRFLRISSQNFDYKTNLATFGPTTHVELFQDQLLLGTLDCATLTVQFGASNHVDTITAHEHVVANQAATLFVLKRTLTCDTLSAKLWPGANMLQSALADGHVHLETVDPIRTMKFSAGTVNAQFSSVTNDVEKVVAQRDVLGMQVIGGKTNRLSGQRAVYTKSTNEVLELTGKPQILYTRETNAVVTTTNRYDFSAPARLYFHGAEILTWDLKTMKAQGSGGQYRVTPLLPNEDPIASQP